MICRIKVLTLGDTSYDVKVSICSHFVSCIYLENKQKLLFRSVYDRVSLSRKPGSDVFFVVATKMTVAGG